MASSKNQKTQSTYTDKYQNFVLPTSIILAAVIIMSSLVISTKIILTKTEEIVKKQVTTALNDGLKNIAGNGTGTADTQFDEQKMVQLAQETSGNSEQLSSCYTSQKYLPKIEKIYEDTNTIGVGGTPGFVIGKLRTDGVVDGYRIKGAYPLQSFQEVITALNDGSASKFDTLIDESDPDGRDTGSKYLYPKASTTIQDDPFLGNKSTASVVIIEFSDFECPFCKKHFQQVYPELKKLYIEPGSAIYMYRDYVAYKAHNPAAQKASLAAYCVREIGGDKKFFEFHDAIYSRTRSNGLGI